MHIFDLCHLCCVEDTCLIEKMEMDSISRGKLIKIGQFQHINLYNEKPAIISFQI